MLWGNRNDGQRGFLYQMGDVIEHVFRPAAKRQEMLLQRNYGLNLIEKIPTKS